MLPAFVTDENFDNRIRRGLLRRKPDLDIVRVQDIGMLSTDERISWNGQRKQVGYSLPMMCIL